MIERTPDEERVLAALDGAEPLYEHARWLLERDEQRSADVVARAVGLMSVAAAVAALLPVGYGLITDVQGAAQAVVQATVVMAEVAFAGCVVVGAVVIAAGQASVAPRAHLLDRWDAWLRDTATGGRPRAAVVLYRDFAGALMDAAEGGNTRHCTHSAV
jgi:hypothetical protein